MKVWAVKKFLRTSANMLLLAPKYKQHQSVALVSENICVVKRRECVFFWKGFFESLAAEAKLDAENSLMMKNAVHARKVIVRRAQSTQYETLRKQRESSQFCRRNSFCS